MYGSEKSGGIGCVWLAEENGCKYTGLRAVWRILLGLVVVVIGRLWAQVPAPYLRCVYTLNNGDVQLVWEWRPVNCGPVHIYASTSLGGPYTQIGVVPFPQNTFTHTGANGNNQTWYYYLTDDPACGSGGILASDTLDNRQPAPPDLVVVSVRNSDSVAVRWRASEEKDAFAYVVYVYDAGVGNFLPLDTVRAPDTVWWHTSGHPLRPQEATLHPETYSIAVMDSCGNTGPLQMRTHTTIFLWGGWQSCPGQFRLRWTRYRGIQVQSYFLEYREERGGDWQVLQGFSGGDSVWQWVPGQVGRYCFRVGGRLVTGDTAYSNPICLQSHVSGLSGRFYLRRVTVDWDNVVRVEWWIDTPAGVQYFRVWRQRWGASGSPQVIAHILYDPQHPPLYFVRDSQIDPVEGRYVYWVDAVDSCDEVHETAQRGTYPYLEVRSSESGLHLLEWTAYERWSGVCGRRVVWRSVSDGPLQVLQTLTCSDLRYTDDVRAIDVLDGQFCYRVCEVEAQNPYGHANLVSCSPTRCVVQDVIVHVANAFAPAVEGVFRPWLRYRGRITEYRFQIVNRWGAPVFETTSYEEGWDGMVNGKPAPQGIYLYEVYVRTSEGREYRRQGYFFLVREED